MIAGLEAEHSWDGGAVVLNRQESAPGVRQWPRYELRRITGLGSLGELEDVREAAFGRRGEVVRPTVRRGKTVSYEGQIRARTLAELRVAQAALLDAMDTTDEQRMDVAPSPALTVTNLNPNPSFETGLAGYSGAGVAHLTQVATWAKAGTKSARYSAVASANSVVMAAIPVVPGDLVSCRLWINVIDPAATGMYFRLVFNNAGHALLANFDNVGGPSPAAANAVGTYELITAGVAPATAAEAIVSFFPYSASASAVEVLLDAWQVIKGAQTAYFDGDTPGARWTGTPHASESRTPDSDRWFRGQPQRCDVVDEQTTRDWRRSFSLSLRLADPRVFHPAALGPFDTAAPIDSDGVVLPLYAPFTIPSPTGWKATTASFDNPGGCEADPVLTLRGPVVNPLLVHDTSWRALRFPAFTVAAAKDLVVDFGARTVIYDGDDVSGALDHGLSDWWDEGVPGLPPGANVCSVAGENMTSATNLGVTFYPADPA